jgi:hypothetical protein
MEQPEFRELEVIAASCGLDGSDAIDDMTDSFDKASKSTASLHFPQGRLSEDRAPLAEAWVKWWRTFLEEYSLKCVKRWVAKCGNLRDTQIMEKLWLQCFEPLWLTGCGTAVYLQVRNLKVGVITSFSRHSEKLSDSEREDLQADLQRWVDWCDQWGEVASLIITEFKEKQRQAIVQTLKELKEYDEASLLGKLKRLISG